MADINKIIEEIENMTVLELNSLVKALEEKFGVSAAAPVVVGGAVPGGNAPEAPAQEEKTEFTVVLKGYADKLKVVRAVKDATGLGLAEAKSLVDNAPKAVKENISKEECDKLVAALKAAGAEIEIK